MYYSTLLCPIQNPVAINKAPVLSFRSRCGWQLVSSTRLQASGLRVRAVRETEEAEGRTCRRVPCTAAFRGVYCHVHVSDAEREPAASDFKVQVVLAAAAECGMDMRETTFGRQLVHNSRFCYLNLPGACTQKALLCSPRWLQQLSMVAM